MSFGILASRWRLLCAPIIANPDHVILYVKAAIALHNYLRTEESNVYCPPGFLDSEDGCGNIVEGGWRQDKEGNTGMMNISHTGSNRYSQNAGKQREDFMNYFCSQEGQVDWQYSYVHRTH